MGMEKVPGVCGEDSQCISEGGYGEASGYVWKTLDRCSKSTRCLNRSWYYFPALEKLRR